MDRIRTDCLTARPKPKPARCRYHINAGLSKPAGGAILASSGFRVQFPVQDVCAAARQAMTAVEGKVSKDIEFQRRTSKPASAARYRLGRWGR